MEWKNIKCFIFDADGVIASSDQQHFAAWSATAEKVGITLSSDFEHKLKGVSRPDSMRLILNENNVEVSEDEFEELLDFKNNLYISLLGDVTDENKIVNIENILKYLKDNNYKTVLASASTNAPMILEKLDLLKYIDEIVDPRTLKKSKPDPEIIFKSVELSGHSAEECVLVEDSQAGIDSGNKAGVHTIAYEPIGNELKDYSVKVKDHNELVAMLMEANNGK